MKHSGLATELSLECMYLSVISEELYQGPTQPGATWDADDILQLTATDPGAPEDLPAWCHFTRNPLSYHDQLRVKDNI